MVRAIALKALPQGALQWLVQRQQHPQAHGATSHVRVDEARGWALFAAVVGGLGLVAIVAYAIIDRPVFSKLMWGLSDFTPFFGAGFAGAVMLFLGLSYARRVASAPLKPGVLFEDEVIAYVDANDVLIYTHDELRRPEVTHFRKNGNHYRSDVEMLTHAGRSERFSVSDYGEAERTVAALVKAREGASGALPAALAEIPADCATAASVRLRRYLVAGAIGLVSGGVVTGITMAVGRWMT